MLMLHYYICGLFVFISVELLGLKMLGPIVQLDVI